MYLTQKASLPPRLSGSRRPGLTLDLPEDRLRRVVHEQFPDWLEVATAAASANGRENQALQRRGLSELHLEDVLLEAITLAGADPDSKQIARRVAEYLAGPPLPLWNYIVIDVRVPVPSLPLFDGWN